MAQITLFPAGEPAVVLTLENTAYLYHYLGMTSYRHELDWIKFAAGVPGYDDRITAVVMAAIKLGAVLAPEHEPLRSST